ncbi:MAG: hypothetical protein JJ974_09290 [Phycisphaerales bacterium]|nr:hypothetical protein [Phycisphaerales bacterium]
MSDRLFPITSLRVESGSFIKKHGCWSLTLNFEPFELPNGYTDEFSDDYKNIETNLGADFVEVEFKDICGKIAQIEEPYDSIDASICVVHAHHPYAIEVVDGTALPKNNKHPGKLKLKGFLWLEFEGLGYQEGEEYSNTPCAFDLSLIPDKAGWSIEPTQAY